MLQLHHRPGQTKLNPSPVKENNMLKNRLFTAWVVVALLVIGVLLVNQMISTARVVSAANDRTTSISASSSQLDCPFSGQERKSMHLVIDKETGIALPYTDSGPAGINGGALGLRYCK
jgi:hypothetical protein